MASNFNQFEYENQFYGFDQPNVVSFVKDTIMANLEEALESVGRKLKATFGDAASNDFVHSALEAYRNALQSLGPKLEAVVRKYFEIHPAIVLPNDELHDGVNEETEAQTLRLIDANIKKIQANSFLIRQLQIIVNHHQKAVQEFSKSLGVLRTAEELEMNNQGLVSSLENLPLDELLGNMSLNQN